MQDVVPVRDGASGQLVYVARLGRAAHYAGSIHDDAFARALGYRRALVPGALVLGAMSHLAARSWGLDWVARGSIEAQFVRPCFDGDRLVVTAAPPIRAPDGIGAALSVLRPDGKPVATGRIALPDAAPPRPAAGPLVAFPAEPPTVAPGALAVGTVLGSADEILSEADHARALADLGETWPAYRMERIVPVGRLLRSLMRDMPRNFRLPAPIILAACAVQNHGPARIGHRLQTSGHITAASERRGRHYGESRQVMLADGAPVGAFRCTMIYAA